MVDKWTEEQVPNLTGKTVIITGANSGTGFAAAQIFAGKNANVILACRNLSKAEQAKNIIKEDIPKAQLDIIHLDLANLDSISKFVEDFKLKHNHLNYLLNNAGIMLAPNEKTQDGFEYHMGVNHLGHFALTGLLIDLLSKSDDARVINMSSGAHTAGDIDFDDINMNKRYRRIKAYGNSKLANLYFTYELDRKLKSSNISIKSMGAHPGWTATKLQTTGLNMRKGIGAWFLKGFMKIGNTLFAMKPRKGTLGMVRAAVDSNLTGGEYIGPKGIRGYPEIIHSNKLSYNIENAKKLWELSEELTGVKFNI